MGVFLPPSVVVARLGLLVVCETDRKEEGEGLWLVTQQGLNKVVLGMLVCLAFDRVLIKKCGYYLFKKRLIDLLRATSYEFVEDEIDLVVVGVRNTSQELCKPFDPHFHHCR